MKTITVICLAVSLQVASMSALASTATWTGKQERVQTVTYKWVLKCEYSLFGRRFWELIDAMSCPATIEVQ